MPDCVELPAAGDRPHSIGDATMHAAAMARPNNVCAPPIVGRETRLAVFGSTRPAARGGLYAQFIERELALRRAAERYDSSLRGGRRPTKQSREPRAAPWIASPPPSRSALRRTQARRSSRSERRRVARNDENKIIY